MPPPDNATERTAWMLHKGAWNALLQQLDPDPEKAANEYESLRRRLVRFFQLHHLTDAERSADACLDRLAKRMDEGVPVEKPISYALGIARMLLREEHEALRRQNRIADELQRSGRSLNPVTSNEVEENQNALDNCLEKVALEQKSDVLLYYSAATREKILLRQKMADDSGISLNALRNRMLRLRKLLEECLFRELAKGPRGPVA